MTTKAKYEKQLIEAQELVANGNYYQAVEIYSDILRTIPDQYASPELKQIRLRALEQRGNALVECHMPKTAIADYEQYQEEAEEGSESIDIFTKIARFYSMIGEYQKAIGLAEEVLVLVKRYPRTPLQNARIYRVLGHAHMNMGHFDEARRNYQNAFSLIENIEKGAAEERTYQAIILNELAIVYSRQSVFDKSIEAYQQALVIYRELGKDKDMAIVLNNMGEIYSHLFDFDMAYQYHQESLSMITEDMRTQSPAFICDLHRNLGLDLFGLGQVEEGNQHFKRAKKISQVVRVSDIAMQLFDSYALAEYSQGNLESAQSMVEECLALAESSHSKSHRAQAYYISGLCHQKSGDLVAANQDWQKAVYLAHETGQRMLLWQIHAALAESMPDADMAIVHYQIAVDIIQQLVEPITDETIREKFLNAPPVYAVLSQVE